MLKKTYRTPEQEAARISGLAKFAMACFIFGKAQGIVTAVLILLQNSWASHSLIVTSIAVLLSVILAIIDNQRFDKEELPDIKTVEKWMEHYKLNN
jgi:hypothetical protein